MENFSEDLNIIAGRIPFYPVSSGVQSIVHTKDSSNCRVSTLHYSVKNNSDGTKILHSSVFNKIPAEFYGIP